MILTKTKLLVHSNGNEVIALNLKPNLPHANLAAIPQSVSNQGFTNTPPSKCRVHSHVGDQMQPVSVVSVGHNRDVAHQTTVDLPDKT